MDDQLDDLMDPWERKLFGDQRRQWWTGAEVQKMRSCNDEPELPEIKPGTRIFDGLPSSLVEGRMGDVHAEAAKEMLFGKRPTEPEARRRFKNAIFAKAYGRNPDGENGSPPIDDNGTGTFGVDMASSPDFSVTSVTGVDNDGQGLVMNHPTDTSRSGIVQNTTSVAGTPPVTLHADNHSGIPTGTYERYPGMPIDWSTIEQVEAMAHQLRPPVFKGVMSKLFGVVSGEVVEYDLLDVDDPGRPCVRQTGVTAWALGGEPILAVRAVSTTLGGTVYTFIDHIPTGCVLTFPPFHDVEMAARVAVEIGRAVGESINTKNVRQAMAGMMPVANYLVDMLSSDRGFTKFDEWRQ